MASNAMDRRGEDRPAPRLIGDKETLVSLILKTANQMERISAGVFDQLKVDRLLVLARMAIGKQPKILQCTRESTLYAILEAAKAGLEWDGKEGVLLPVWNSKLGAFELQFRAMYRGLIKQLVNAGAAVDVDAVCVYKGENFRVFRGSEKRIEHEMDFTVNREDDNIIAAYAIWELPNDQKKFHVLTRAQIEKRMRTSQSVDKKTGKITGPWAGWFEEQCVKTVIRAGAKYIPPPLPVGAVARLHNAQLEAALALDSEMGRNQLRQQIYDALPDAERQRLAPPSEVDIMNKHAAVFVKQIDQSRTEDEIDGVLNRATEKSLPEALLDILAAHGAAQKSALSGEVDVAWPDETMAMLEAAEKLRTML